MLELLPKQLLASADKVEERKSICEACPFSSKGNLVCTKCGCCIPAKVRFKQAECPEKKWLKIKED